MLYGSVFFTPSILPPRSAISKNYMALKRQIHEVKARSPQRAALKSHPQSPVAFTGFPSFTLLETSGWCLSQGKQCFGASLTGETSSDTTALCGMSAKLGPMEGRSTQGTELIYQYLCVLKALPQSLGWEFLNSSLPPSGSRTARCWDRGQPGQLTCCRKQGQQQLLHLKGRMTRITSRPALSAMRMVNARTGAHSLRSKQPFSSTAKYTLCPKWFFISYLLEVSVPSMANKAKQIGH